MNIKSTESHLAYIILIEATNLESSETINIFHNREISYTSTLINNASSKRLLPEGPTSTNKSPKVRIANANNIYAHTYTYTIYT